MHEAGIEYPVRGGARRPITVHAGGSSPGRSGSGGSSTSRSRCSRRRLGTGSRETLTAPRNVNGSSEPRRARRLPSTFPLDLAAEPSGADPVCRRISRSSAPRSRSSVETTRSEWRSSSNEFDGVHSSRTGIEVRLVGNPLCPATTSPESVAERRSTRHRRLSSARRHPGPGSRRSPHRSSAPTWTSSALRNDQSAVPRLPRDGWRRRIMARLGGSDLRRVREPQPQEPGLVSEAASRGRGLLRSLGRGTSSSR